MSNQCPCMYNLPGFGAAEEIDLVANGLIGALLVVNGGG